LKYLPLKGIITDGTNFYPKIIDELGVPHQICVFHKIQNLMNLHYKIINRDNMKIRREEKKRKMKNLKLTIKILKTNDNQFLKEKSPIMIIKTTKIHNIVILEKFLNFG
jgi:hypothetical protein